MINHYIINQFKTNSYKRFAQINRLFAFINNFINYQMFHDIVSIKYYL